uniref:Integrase catalytic domain-containing protein n=1 Tax=Monopterus albus TaxID=43700 RepID=A0A3Q3K986_MONAL
MGTFYLKCPQKTTWHVRKCALLGGSPAVWIPGCERVAMDILELPVTSKGNRYVLVVQDYFTKFVNLYPLHSHSQITHQSAQTFAHCLLEDYVLLHGVPETVHSDQGQQFESEVVQTLCRLLNIKKTRTTAYHPQSDGMVERFNRTLIDQLAKTLLTYGGEWDDYVKHVAFTYNTTTHSCTRFTPFFLTHGREAQVPSDVLLPTRALDTQSLSVAFSGARMHSEMAHDRQKLYHDEASRHQPYELGAMVWLRNPVESRMKLVMDSCGELGLTYRIVNPFDANEKAQVVHYDRLRPYLLPVTHSQPLSDVHSQLSVSMESGVSGGAGLASPQTGLSALSDSRCSGESFGPSVSRTGRACKHPGHLRDFVMF